MWIEKRERKHMQALCPHEYKEVYVSKMVKDYSYDVIKQYDIYCPICHHKQEDLKAWKWKQIKNIQEARKEYELENGITEREVYR